MPIENLSYTLPNKALLRKVLDQAESQNRAESQISPVSIIKCCDNEIQLLLKFVQKYVARPPEPLTVSDTKFLEACKKNVRGTPHSPRTLVEKLQSLATQALAQPTLAQQQQAISLRWQAAQQEWQAAQQQWQAPQQEWQAPQQEWQAPQQERQAPQLPTTAELMRQQITAIYEEEEEWQAAQQERQAPQLPTTAELMRQQITAIY